MKTLTLSTTLAFLACGASSLAQSVAFEKYELDNGMTVILHEDHTLPVVAVNTWFRVGSKDEPAGRSGFAHLFEHLMFMGTERVPGNQFDVIMETGGGWNNASTSFDRTNYFSNGPSSLLPTLLWLDADRLEDLGRTMTQEKLDLQRDVVRNERRQVIENAPYGNAELDITAIMFPAGHPYHDEVIGTHADLEAASVRNVTDFFATFYVPNNASLVVAGDFDPAGVKPLIESLFGSIPRGAEPMHRASAPVRLEGEKRAVTLDQVPLPKICFCYHAPPELADGNAELDLLAAILADGKSSRLYDRLVVREGLASEVSSFVAPGLLQSVFRVDVIASEGADLDRIEAIVDEELDRVLAGGISEGELEPRRATIELAKLTAMQSIADRADALNAYQFHWGAPDGFARDLGRYRAADPARVLAWARTTLRDQGRLVMRILPAEPDRSASARDARPDDFKAAPFSPPTPEFFTLSNGVPVKLWRRPGVPLVGIVIAFAGPGPQDEPAHSGWTYLASQMLAEGAGGRSASEFSEAVQRLGATFETDAGTEHVLAGMTVIARNLEPAADLLRDAVLRPTMSPEDFERASRLHAEALSQEEDEPALVAMRVGARLVFGDASPYAWPAEGTLGTIAGARLADIDAARRRAFDPSRSTILVAGDVTKASLQPILEARFGKGWTSAIPADAHATAPAGASEGALRVAIVDRPGAVQTVVRFTAPGVPANDATRLEREVLNVLLGGSFTSRLNQNLREKNGYTYGARSVFSMDRHAGLFTAGASVRADATGESIREFITEFERLRGGDVTDAEAAKARESYRTDLVESYEGVDRIVGTASDLFAAGLDDASIAEDLRRLGAIDAARLNTLARTAINLDHGVLVLVGDRATILEEIRDLGLPAPASYSPTGDPIEP